MKLAIDACTLTLLINPEASPPKDPATGEALTYAHERVRQLIYEIEYVQGVIVVPTPALAEVLVEAGDAGPEVLSLINRSGSFRIATFDMKAAIELAQLNRSAQGSAKRRDGDEPYQKIKLDRQIVAIARTAGAETILSDDRSLGTFAKLNGFTVIKTHELKLPEKNYDLFEERP